MYIGFNYMQELEYSGYLWVRDNGHDDYAGLFSGIINTGKLVHNEVDNKPTMQ